MGDDGGGSNMARETGLQEAVMLAGRIRCKLVYGVWHGDGKRRVIRGFLLPAYRSACCHDDPKSDRMLGK